MKPIHLSTLGTLCVSVKLILFICIFFLVIFSCFLIYLYIFSCTHNYPLKRQLLKWNVAMKFLVYLVPRFIWESLLYVYGGSACNLQQQAIFNCREYQAQQSTEICPLIVATLPFKKFTLLLYYVHAYFHSITCCTLAWCGSITCLPSLTTAFLSCMNSVCIVVYV